MGSLLPQEATNSCRHIPAKGAAVKKMEKFSFSVWEPTERPISNYIVLEQMETIQFVKVFLRDRKALYKL